MFAGLKVEIISLAYFRMFAKKSIWNAATTLLWQKWVFIHHRSFPIGGFVEPNLYL